jgi:hypothetical protein
MINNFTLLSILYRLIFSLLLYCVHKGLSASGGMPEIFVLMKDIRNLLGSALHVNILSFYTILSKLHPVLKEYFYLLLDIYGTNNVCLQDIHQVCFDFVSRLIFLDQFVCINSSFYFAQSFKDLFLTFLILLNPL